MSEFPSTQSAGDSVLSNDYFDELIAAFMAKDLPAVMSFFADDAVLIDPHYPQGRMQGRAAIERGLRWGLGNIVKPGFIVRQSRLDGESGFFEVDTHHVFKGGMSMHFDQIFAVELKAGKIIRLQAYVPYAPPGIAGLLTRLTGWFWRLTGKH